MAQDNDDAYAEAVRRIEAAVASGVTELDLSMGSLQVIPPEIAKLSTLRTLNLGSGPINLLAGMATR